MRDSLRRFGAILGADLRERSRSTRFWLMLMVLAGATWWSMPPLGSAYLVLALNGHLRGEYSSAWIGMVVAMLSLWLSLIGFYVVRGTLVRDIETRVWQLLVATPMTRAAYLLAKWCSNLLVLLLVSAASLAVAVLLQWLRAEDRAIDVWELVKPTLLIALPSLALTAACAVWFDMLPWLRRTAGNLLYFLLWLALLVGGITVTQSRWGQGGGTGLGDPRGVMLFSAAAQEQAAPQLSETLRPGFCMGCGLRPGTIVRTFRWRHWQPSALDLAGRLAWLLLAGGGVMLAAPWLDRAAAHAGPAQAVTQSAGRRLRWLDALLSPLQRSVTGALVAAELQRRLRQRRGWWWFLLLAASVAAAAAPPTFAALALVAVWMLMLDVYARAAVDDGEQQVAALIFSAPGGGWQVLQARWLMLVLLGGLPALPALLRWLVCAPELALATLVLVPSLATWALALGLLTRGPRAFELLAFLGAYLALEQVPGLNVAVAPLATAGWHLGLLAPGATLAWLCWPTAQRGGRLSAFHH